MSVLAFLLLYIFWNKYSIAEKRGSSKTLHFLYIKLHLKNKSNQRQTFEQ